MKIDDFEVECKSLFSLHVEDALRTVVNVGSSIDSSRVDIVPDRTTKISVRGSEYRLKAKVFTTELPNGKYLLKVSDANVTRIRSRV